MILFVGVCTIRKRLSVDFVRICNYDTIAILLLLSLLIRFVFFFNKGGADE